MACKQYKSNIEKNLSERPSDAYVSTTKISVAVQELSGRGVTQPPPSGQSVVQKHLGWARVNENW